MAITLAQKIDTTTDIKILTAMIQNKEFLVRMVGLPRDPFESEWANKISRWCLKYLQQYGDCPGDEIQNLFNAWAKKVQDETTVRLIEKVLQNLSDQAERSAKPNLDYLIDVAEKRFNDIRLKKLVSDLDNQVGLGDPAPAFETLSEFKRISLSQQTGRNPFDDPEIVRQAFEMTTKSLFRLPGALGEFFEDQLGRECFVSFLAPEKRGKSWWLLEMAYRALRQRCRVAMFEAGDMTERQVLFRMASRISGVPIKRRYCGAFEIPINIEKSLKEEDNKENNHYRYVAKETKIIENPLTWGEAYKVGQDYMNKFANNGKNFMLSCTPNNTLTISGIESSLEMWEREKGFVPDVIIIDYADLIVPESAYKDFRHQVNEIWMSLRKMSEERHCLVLTATQAKASAYGSRIMDMSHPSEDKRKNAHVTGMVALNQDADEKKDGRMRLNWTVLREGEFTVEKCVYVAGCLRIGRPFMCSCW